MVLVSPVQGIAEVLEPVAHRFCGRQGQPQAGRFIKRIIQVFDLEFRQTAGFKVTVGHARAVLLQDRAVRKASLERRPYSGWIRAALLHEQHGFGHRRDCDCDDGLICKF